MGWEGGKIECVWMGGNKGRERATKAPMLAKVRKGPPPDPRPFRSKGVPRKSRLRQCRLKERPRDDVVPLDRRHRIMRAIQAPDAPSAATDNCSCMASAPSLAREQEDLRAGRSAEQRVPTTSDASCAVQPRKRRLLHHALRVGCWSIESRQYTPFIVPLDHLIKRRPCLPARCKTSSNRTAEKVHARRGARGARWATRRIVPFPRRPVAEHHRRRPRQVAQYNEERSQGTFFDRLRPPPAADLSFICECLIARSMEWNGTVSERHLRMCCVLCVSSKWPAELPD